MADARVGFCDNKRVEGESARARMEGESARVCVEGERSLMVLHIGTRVL